MDNNEKEEYISQSVKDSIVDEIITDLLSDRPYYPKEMPGNKYELSVKDPFYENRFRHGIKEMPPAYSKTKSAAKSMFECETLKDGRLNVVGTFTTDSKYIKVNIPGLSGRYLAIRNIKQLLREGVSGTMFRLSASEICFILVKIDRRALIGKCTT